MRALVRKHEPQQINDAIHGIFGSLEVGKRHEISTDQDKQAAGEVRQGGAPVDVQPKAPEAPKPAVAPAAPAKQLPLTVQSKLFANLPRFMLPHYEKPKRPPDPKDPDKDSAPS